MMDSTAELIRRDVKITVEHVVLEGELILPQSAGGIVLFVHGSGSSRHSPRNKFVAEIIRNAGIGTLLFDLLTPVEEAQDRYKAHLRFDIELLANRLIDVSRWIKNNEDTRNLKIGYFGASTGGGAALVAAAELGGNISAVVSRGGRPDLAGKYLAYVQAPTLLIVGGHDTMVIDFNRQAYRELKCQKALEIIPGASHLFEEPGALEQVAALATNWLKRYL